ncbi:MAG: DNA-formamidopyrimidine glycosylase family protein [Candidatus Brocadiia bacterium]
MPELPDVEAMRRYFSATALHQPVEAVTVQDDYVLRGTNPGGLGRALAGRRFEATDRHGKNLLVRMDNDRWLRLHFGMTGNLKYFKADGAPEFTRVLFRFENSYRLAYVSQRKLGMVSLTDGPDALVESEDLGPDALRMSWGQFRCIMGNRRGMLKSTLMNQHIVAGLGNVYADEVLFQARMNPRQTVDELSGEELRQLYRAIQRVLETSIGRGADGRDMPRRWLIHRRGEGRTCPRCGAEIERVKINQRSTYYCPECQSRR